ncbi:hypothetical protein QTP88_027568 [Uroleucon formosanum]
MIFLLSLKNTQSQFVAPQAAVYRSRENKLLKQVEDTQNVGLNVEIAEIQECISHVHVFGDCDEENINEWLLMDTNDPGYQILSDDEIVRSLFEEEENEIDDLTEGENGPSHSEAFDALDLAFKWFERQEESNTTQLLQSRRLRDIAAIKRKLTMKQTKIS